jgi:hypothetical protein
MRTGILYSFTRFSKSFDLFVYQQHPVICCVCIWSRSDNKIADVVIAAQGSFRFWPGQVNLTKQSNMSAKHRFGCLFCFFQMDVHIWCLNFLPLNNYRWEQDPSLDSNAYRWFVCWVVSKNHCYKTWSDLADQFSDLPNRILAQVMFYIDPSFESSLCKTWSILSKSLLGRLVLIITHTGGSYKILYFSFFWASD